MSEESNHGRPEVDPESVKVLRARMKRIMGEMTSTAALVAVMDDRHGMGVAGHLQSVLTGADTKQRGRDHMNRKQRRRAEAIDRRKRERERG